jgi:hypothetical protein
MIKTSKITAVNYRDIVRKFIELTNFGTTDNGAWNADFTKKYVVNIVLSESTRQNGQDWMCRYSPIDYDYVTKDVYSLIRDDRKDEFRGNFIYDVYLGEVMQWLTLNGELPLDGEFLVED